MAVFKVAIAGATGALGTPVLKELLASGFEVTVLTRKTSEHSFSDRVKVAKVDYTSSSELEEALKGHDALISTLTTSAVGQQDTLLEAAIAVGVKRILPSEFGSDTTNKKNQKLPVFGPKLATQKLLQEKCKGTSTTYTFIVNNIFLDWGINVGWLLDVKEKKIDLYDGGNTRYSSTPLFAVAKGVVGVLKHLDETANREVKIDSVVLTQKKLLELGKRAVGEEGWTVTESKTEEIEKEAYENLEKRPEDVMGWVRGFLYRAIFSKEHKPEFTVNDNDLLKVPQVGERDIIKMMQAAQRQ